MLEIDIPEILEELIAAFEGYEHALVDNDIATLNALFWNSPLTLRYGTRASEIQRGHEEIAAFRISRGVIDQRRLLRNRRITTFGCDFGVANTEFIPAGSQQIGRQSQTWMRTANGWKIVSAHVSYGV
jgi:hypothetical protein